MNSLAPELPRPVVVLSAPETPDASFDSNRVELERLGVCSAIELPRADVEALGAVGDLILGRLDKFA